jgi:TonB family protein
MYFDFEDNHPDLTPIGHTISWREGILLSIVFHLLAIIGVLVMPPFDSSRAAAQRIVQQIELQRQRERDSTRFVFVQPHVDLPATRPLSPKAEPSDKDRNAQTRERAENPTNSLPFSRGNTPDRVEALRSAPPPPQAQPPGPSPQNSPANTQSSAEAGSPPPAPSVESLSLPGLRAGNGKVPDAPAATGAGAGRGLLGAAVRDLRQMVQQDAFDNQGGSSGAFGPSIQFDTKGVEFGPWIRRFIAQIKRNWLIPLAAMAMKGHVVVTFYILKDGTIAALAVPGPCNVDAFNRAAYNALAASNPTYPLPPEYPSDRAFFTVTFYYNETPLGGGY